MTNPSFVTQLYLKTGTSAFPRQTTRFASVVSRDLANQSQTQANASTLLRSNGTVERLEDALSFWLWNAGSSVFNAELSARRGEGHDRRLNKRSSSIATGVFQQVPHEPSQHARVALNASGFPAHFRIIS